MGKDRESSWAAFPPFSILAWVVLYIQRTWHSVDFVGKNAKRGKMWNCSVRNADSKLYYLLDLLSLSFLLSDYVIKTCKNIENLWVNLPKHTFHEFFIETESRLATARVWGKGAIHCNCRVGAGFYFGVRKMFWNWIEVVVAHIVDVLKKKITELFIIKWLILWCMNFTSIKRSKKKKPNSQQTYKKLPISSFPMHGLTKK